MTDDINAGLYSAAQIDEIIAKLESRRISRQDRHIRFISLNPDFSIVKFQKTYHSIFGIKKNFFADNLIERVEINGKTKGIHGNNLNAMPVSELARLTMALSEKEMPRDKKDIIQDFGKELFNDIPMETSRNIEQREYLDMLEEKERLNELEKSKKTISDLEKQLEAEKMRQQIIINQNQEQTEKKNKKSGFFGRIRKNKKGKGNEDNFLS